MPVTSNEVHTFTCSIPYCKFARTVAGPLAIVRKELVTAGWAFPGVIISGDEYDLCPEHNKEIRAFFGFEVTDET